MMRGNAVNAGMVWAVLVVVVLGFGGPVVGGVVEVGEKGTRLLKKITFDERKTARGKHVCNGDQR